ncbi:hypothetical protein [Gaetbulibacter sp. PBL-D1]|uniref:hypothetical protein n=1 Tax=Gaetbulibacter sp. PBL-D1 TaxID=3422594 RepID=UPI003D2F04BC
MENFKQESRKNYGSSNEQKSASLEQLNTGCLQRIADSLEKIENPYQELLETNEYLRRRYRKLSSDIETLRYQNRALKGVITRMKNKSNN